MHLLILSSPNKNGSLSSKSARQDGQRRNQPSLISVGRIPTAHKKGRLVPIPKGSMLSSTKSVHGYWNKSQKKTSNLQRPLTKRSTRIAGAELNAAVVSLLTLS